MMGEQEPRDRPAAEPISPSDFERLRYEVEKIKDRLEEDKKGFLGWVRRWGIALAFFLSVLSLFQTTRDEFRNFFRGVKVDKINDAPFTVTYEVDQEGEVTSIGYLFSVRVDNQGGDDYTIDSLDVVISAPKRPSLSLTPSVAVASCINPEDGDKPLSTPFVVRPKKDLSMKCTAALKPWEGGRELKEPGVLQQLTFRLTSKDDDPVHENFCATATGELVLNPGDPKCY
jgi:hypothetical protein